MTNTTEDREVVVTRVIDTPREIVFAAFTEQEHIKKWWAPSEVNNARDECGAWRPVALYPIRT